MNESDYENDRKARMIERHLKGAQRYNERKENLEARKKRGGPIQRRQRDESYGDPDGWHDHETKPHVRTRREGKAASDGARQTRTKHARVSSVARTEVRVLLADGSERSVRLTPSVLASGGVVVGDQVHFDDQDRVTARDERYSLLERAAPGSARRRKLIAANVDLGLVVLAPRTEGLSLGFLDRAIAALRGGGIQPLIVVTKVDLLGASSERETIEESLGPWADAGYSVHFVSSPLGEGIAGLRAEVAGNVAVLLGHSGVGKSTLVNALDPAARQDTGAVREDDSRGRHTTTASRLIPFASGGAIVDTPGIRQLVPEVKDPAALAASIPELAPFLGLCRFTDCAHGAEPDCAVTAAARADPAVAGALKRWHRLLDPDS